MLLFFGRVALETAVVGIVPFALPTGAEVAAIAPGALYALAAVDALWGLTTGFLIGRSAAVWHAWRRAERSPAPAPAPRP